MSSIHKGLTITAKIDERNLQAVNDLLENYRKDLRFNHDNYRKLLPSTFFISWLTLPTQLYAGKEKLPARIILMSSYTGAKNKHITELVHFLKDKLEAVFSFSDEFPKGPVSEEILENFLKNKSIRNTFYSGFKFIETQEVEQEKNLKAAVLHQSTLWTDTEKDFKNLSPQDIKQRIEEWVEDESPFIWAIQPIKNLTRNKWTMLLPLILFGLVMMGSLVSLILLIFKNALVLKIFAAVFPVFLLGMLALFLMLRRNEKNPHRPNEAVPHERIRQIVALEKNPVVNEMTVIAPLKKGWIRRVFLGVTLRLVALVGYFTYIPTVHTARWLQMDRGKRLVFIANFDNLSEAYAHDFVDSERRAMNMAVVFSHAFGFPATRWLVHKNYNHRSEYMKGVRAHQKITQFWYAFNRELSVENLKTNRKFRQGLGKKMDDKAIKEWLLTI